MQEIEADRRQRSRGWLLVVTVIRGTLVRDGCELFLAYLGCPESRAVKRVCSYSHEIHYKHNIHCPDHLT